MLGFKKSEPGNGQQLIVTIKLIVYTILPVISLGFLWNFEPSSKLIPLVGLIALAILIGVGQLVTRKQWAPPFRGSVLAWVPDLIVITGIIYYTGGPVSDFWFLYVLVIVTGGLARGVRGSLWAGGMSSIIYIVLMYLSFKEILSPVLPPDPVMLRADWAPTIALTTFLHVTFFFITTAIVGYFTDRFLRKQKELDTTTSELNQLRMDTNIIMETIPAGILACDFDKDVLYFNRAGMEILGMPGHLISRGLSVTTLLISRPSFYNIVCKFIEDGLPTRPVEMEILLPNGDTRPIGVDAIYLVDREGEQRGLVIYFNDLSEAKAIAQQIRISDRLSAVGELSRDLAHEIRNPLAVVRGSVEFMARELKPGGQMARLMDGILRESDRLNSLIYEFLEFSRLSPPESQSVPVKEILRSLKEMAVPSGIIEIINGTESKTTCWADYDQLLRALNTLISEINRLNQSTGTVQLFIAEPEENIEIFPEEYIMIPRDRVGFIIRFPERPLPDKTINSLFRPFHHSDSKHRGLGLCTAHRIIESHKGEIRVVNQLQHGLALLIIMPLPSDYNDDLAKMSQDAFILEENTA